MWDKFCSENQDKLDELVFFIQIDFDTTYLKSPWISYSRRYWDVQMSLGSLRIAFGIFPLHFFIFFASA